MILKKCLGFIHLLTHPPTHSTYLHVCMSVTLFVKCWAEQGVGFMNVNQANGGGPLWVYMPMVGEVLNINPILHETKGWDYVSAVKKRYSVK